LTNGGIKGNVSYGTLTTIIESSIKFGLIYVGSDDGLVHVSKDGGYSWTNISSSLPENMWVSSIYPSNFHEGRVYLSLNGYRWDNFESMIYVSDDFGLNWSRIGNDLPREPVNVIIEDTKNENLLYVGTDHGVYASLDIGNNFHAFMGGLPGTPVHDLVIHPRDNDLVVGTHGRSVFIANVEFLQKIDEDILSKSIHVFEVDGIKYSSRWGSKNWYGDLIEPSASFVVFSDKDEEIHMEIINDEGVLIDKKLKISYGINYINNNLLADKKKKYLSKGKYRIKVSNLDSSYEENFVIN